MALAVLSLPAEPPGMAQTSPPSTPGHPLGAGAVVGEAPDCSIGSRFDAPAAMAVADADTYALSLRLGFAVVGDAPMAPTSTAFNRAWLPIVVR